jgi:hypothetical protein
LLVFTSQPLSTFPSQLALGAVQAMEQFPPLQEAVPPTVLQTFPQVPQWLVLVLVLASQPLLAMLSQLP